MLSVVVVVVTSYLAVLVSPVYFAALLAALTVPAWLTIRTYKSPNTQRAATSEQRVRVDYTGR
jgi:hypothetical protein